MPFPEPVPGQVIRYAYLWSHEHASGQEEGLKSRPCVVVLSVSSVDGDRIVTVVPITHRPPEASALAVEIPHPTKLRLGLDDERSWIVLTQANRFIWPGPDLRLGPTGQAESVLYGLLPRALFNTVRERLATAVASQLLGVVPRTQ